MESKKEKYYLLELMDEVIFENKDKLDNKLIENLKDFTELKVHKILYFLYGFHFSKNDEELFEPNFQAWRYGPVEINYRYNSPKKAFKLMLVPDNKEKVKRILSTLMIKDVWELVELSHSTKPWKDAFGNGRTFSVIPKESIKEYFKGI